MEATAQRERRNLPPSAALKLLPLLYSTVSALCNETSSKNRKQESESNGIRWEVTENNTHVLGSTWMIKRHLICLCHTLFWPQLAWTEPNKAALTDIWPRYSSSSILLLVLLCCFHYSAAAGKLHIFFPPSPQYVVKYLLLYWKSCMILFCWRTTCSHAPLAVESEEFKTVSSLRIELQILYLPFLMLHIGLILWRYLTIMNLITSEASNCYPEKILMIKKVAHQSRGNVSA